MDFETLRCNGHMKAVIGDMTISTGGVLRLNKNLVERMGIRPGDRVIIMQDVENPRITIQIQRGDEVIFLLNDAEVVRLQNIE